MSDQPVRTMVRTEDGVLPFQRYFVDGAANRSERFEFQGRRGAPRAGLLKRSRATPRGGDLPIQPFHQHRSDPRGAGHAPASPAVRRWSRCRRSSAAAPSRADRQDDGGARMPASARAVAEHYDGLLDGFVLDEADAAEAEAIDLPCLATHPDGERGGQARARGRGPGLRPPARRGPGRLPRAAGPRPRSTACSSDRSSVSRWRLSTRSVTPSSASAAMSSATWAALPVMMWRSPLDPGGRLRRRTSRRRTRAQWHWDRGVLLRHPMQLRHAVLEPRHRVEPMVRVVADREPDVAVAHGAAQRGSRRRSRSADGLLHGLGQEGDVGETHVAAFEVRGVLGPQDLERLQVLVGDAAAVLERRCTDRFELLLHPAGTGAQHQAPAGEHVDGGRDLGGVHRSPIGMTATAVISRGLLVIAASQANNVNCSRHSPEAAPGQAPIGVGISRSMLRGTTRWSDTDRWSKPSSSARRTRVSMRRAWRAGRGLEWSGRHP